VVCIRDLFTKSFKKLFLFLGLCRTGEIFGVKELVLGSIRILEDQQFLNLSMTAHKWLRIKQVMIVYFCYIDLINCNLGTRKRIKGLFD
jgi:hypothetical protein